MRIGIIGGGGAGLATAWLLEGEHDVTLYERQPQLGGHALTVPVQLGDKTAYMDAGFEFLSDGMFPTFARLLRLVNAPLRTYGATATLYATNGDYVRIMPPKRNGRVVWSGFAPRHLSDMVQFAYVLRAARGLMERKDDTVTVERFVEGLSGVGRRFKDTFLYPFLLAQWCVELKEFRQFMAYDALRYSYMHFGPTLDAPTMLEIEGGVQVYVELVRKQLERAAVRTAAGVERIERLADGFQLVAADGSRERYDAVVLATNAHVASELLRGVEGVDEACRQFGRVQYFKTTIAIHGDTRLMPRRREDWSVVNTRWDGTHSQNTVWKEWRSPVGHPLFKSWVTYEEKLPEPLYASVEFDHPKIDGHYFEAQKALEPLQGKEGLWFAGMQTYDVDCHESVILSAARVARRLSPNAPRLRQLLAQ